MSKEHINNHSTPPITIYTGPWHPELEETLFDDLKRIRETDPLQAIVVLVGSRLSGDYLQWKLSTSDSGIFNLRFITITDLADSLNLPGRVSDPRSNLPVGGELMAAAVAANGLSGEQYYSSVKDRPGFHRMLAKTMTDLDEAGIGNISANIAGIRDPMRKWNSVAHLRESYLKSLAPFRNCSENLAVLPNPVESFRRAFGCQQLHVYGIYDFNALQFRLVESLANDVELKVYLPFWSARDEWGTAFSYSEPTLRMLEKLPGSVTVDLIPQCGCPAKGFARRTFRYKPEEQGHFHMPQGMQVRAFSASGVVAEVEQIVSRINELALWEEIPLDNIGVLLWDPGNYLKPLIAELESAGLPYCNTLGFRLSESAEGQAVQALLGLDHKKLKRVDVVDLIASHQLLLSNREDEIPDTSTWEMITVDSGIIEEDRKGWIRTLDFIADQLDSTESSSRDSYWQEKRVEIARLRRFIDLLFDGLAGLPSEGSIQAYVGGMIQLTETFIPSSPNRDRIIDAISALAGLEVISARINREHFCSLVQYALNAVTINRGRYRCDGITIFDKMNGRGIRCEVLFIPGLTQGLVPVRPTEDPLITDNERIAITKRLSPDGKIFLPLQARRNEEERMLFTLAVDSAINWLFLSYSNWDESKGEQRFPSRFLLEIFRVIIGRPIAADELEKLPFFEHGSTSSESESVDRISALKRRNTNPDQYSLLWIQQNVQREHQHLAFRRIFEGSSATFDRLMKAYKARYLDNELTEWDGVLPEDQFGVEQIVQAFSVTGLENYAACPFNYFIHDILGVKPWEEPELLFELKSDVVGILIHRILKRFYESASDGERLPLKADDSEWAQAEIHRILESEMERGYRLWSAPDTAWNLAKITLQSRLKRLVSQICADEDDEYIMDQVESEFREQVTISEGDSPQTITLTGRIDRIDRIAGSRGLRIIDYKTGKTIKKPGKFNGGSNLQLPVYLKILLDKEPELNTEQCQAAYYHIEADGFLTIIPFSGSDLVVKEKDLEFIIGTITTSIRNGLFPPVPEKETCKRCKLKNACDHVSRWKFALQENDRRLENFHRMREIE